MQSYPDQLLTEVWVGWSDPHLSAKPDGTESFQEILGAENSDERSRASDLYKLGLLRGRLTSHTSPIGWGMLMSGESIHTRLGYLAYAIGVGMNADTQSPTIRAGFSALCTIFALQLGFTYDGKPISLPSIFLYLLDRWPRPKSATEDDWLVELAAAMFSTCKYNPSALFVPYLTGGTSAKLVVVTGDATNAAKQTTHHLTPSNIGSKRGEIDWSHTLPRRKGRYWAHSRGFFGSARQVGLGVFTQLARLQRERFDTKEPDALATLLEKPADGEPADPLSVIASSVSADPEAKKEWEVLVKTLYDGVLESLRSIKSDDEKTSQVFYAGSVTGGKVEADALEIEVPKSKCHPVPEKGDKIRILKQTYSVNSIKLEKDTVRISATRL